MIPRFLKQTLLLKAGLLTFLFLSVTTFALAQEKNGIDISGSASFTNKGISTIPSLTLGKPAAIFNLSVGNRLTFDPEIRFSMEGKPWSFLFWFRYQFVQNEKFYLKMGANSAISFAEVSAVTNGVPRDLMEARRFLAGEINSSYTISNNIKVGTYYLYSRGFDLTVPDNTHFISLNSTFSTNPLSNNFFFNVRPQAYYLIIDENTGFYAAVNIALGYQSVPFTISSTINKEISSEIVGNEDPLWNLSINYVFAF